MSQVIDVQSWSKINASEQGCISHSRLKIIHYLPTFSSAIQTIVVPKNEKINLFYVGKIFAKKKKKNEKKWMNDPQFQVSTRHVIRHRLMHNHEISPTTFEIAESPLSRVSSDEEEHPRESIIPNNCYYVTRTTIEWKRVLKNKKEKRVRSVKSFKGSSAWWGWSFFSHPHHRWGNGTTNRANPWGTLRDQQEGSHSPSN